MKLEDPHADKAVRTAHAREGHVVEESNVPMERVSARQGHDVERRGPTGGPWEY